MSSAVGRPTPVRGARGQAAVLSVWWLVITGLVLLAGVALTGRPGRAVRVEDNDAARWFAGHRSPPLTDAAEGISLLGNTYTTIGVSVVCLVALWWRLRRRRPVLFLAAAGIGELATYLVTVNLVHRPRPPVLRFDEGLNPLHSYPSGHVAAAMATYGGMAVLLWVHHRRARRWLTPLLLAPPALIALSRMYLGVHHPTDVLASVLFMAGWLNRCAAALLATGEGSVDAVHPDLGDRRKV
jgi:membrane-associated phospholipid phosphatase